MILDKYGQELKARNGYRILYTFSEQVNAFSYAIQNTSGKQADATLDCSESQDMIFSSRTDTITKRVDASATEFMMHAMVKPNANQFTRKEVCRMKEVKDNNNA